MLGVFFVIIAGLLWAVDTLIRYPLLFSGISAERIVFTEHLFLVMIFIPLLIRDRKVLWQTKISSVFYFIVIGVFGSAIGTLCFTKAFTMINPSLVILLQKLQPIVSFTLASFFLGEKMKKPFLCWAGVALLGGLLISSPDILPGLSNFDFKMGFLSQTAMMGYLLTMVAVVSWGASTVFGKKLTAQGLDEGHIMGGRFLFGFIFMAFYAYANKSLMHFDWQALVWGKILLMVLLSGLLGMYFYYKGLKTISARVCAIAEMFFPLSAVAINWVFLGAKLTPVQMIGAGLLTLGSAVIQLKHY
ncbi:MAG: DMT family transporter [Bacteriovorax sp.]|nr:DMT family transporter [Bacteriovorax sp.]